MTAAAFAFALAQTALVQPGPRPVVYLTSPADRVEAVEAFTGRVRWASSRLAIALAARGDRVLALRPPGRPNEGGCAPVLVDARTGKVLQAVVAKDTPPPGCPVESLRGSCRTAPFVRDGADYVGWVSTWHPMPGGAYRGPDDRYPPGSFGSHQQVCAVDWLRGAVTPAASALADSVSVLNPRANPQGATVTVDGLFACADRETSDGRATRLVLRRWRGADRLPGVVMGEPPWNSCGVSFTLDGRHALAVWQVPERHDPILYHVRLFDVATGKLVAELDARSWPAAALVCGPVLVAYFPWRVFALDLTTGRERWSRPVKDLTYRGPTPPAARSVMT